MLKFINENGKTILTGEEIKCNNCNCINVYYYKELNKNILNCKSCGIIIKFIINNNIK